MGTTVDSLARSNLALNQMDVDKENQRKRNELAYAQLALEERRRAADDQYRQMAFNNLSAAQRSDDQYRNMAFNKPYSQMTQAEQAQFRLAQTQLDDQRNALRDRIASAEKIALKPWESMTPYERETLKYLESDKAADRRLKGIELYIKAQQAGALTPDQATIIAEQNTAYDNLAKMANDEFLKRAKEYDGWFTSKDAARKKAWDEVVGMFGGKTVPNPTTMTFAAKVATAPSVNTNDIFGTINKLISGDNMPAAGSPGLPALPGGGGAGPTPAPAALPPVGGAPRVRFDSAENPTYPATTRPNNLMPDAALAPGVPAMLPQLPPSYFDESLSKPGFNVDPTLQLEALREPSPGRENFLLSTPPPTPQPPKSRVGVYGPYKSGPNIFDALGRLKNAYVEKMGWTDPGRFLGPPYVPPEPFDYPP